ncbi:MAG: hypothetical protein WED05_07705 [Candidatus Atabeyarchaeum deiterrae]
MSLEPDDHFKTWTRRIEESKRIRGKALKLLDQGDFGEAADAFLDYAASCSEYGEVTGLECSTMDAAETFELKNALPEAGKLYLFTANSLKKAQLWGDAVSCYLKAAEVYGRIGEKRFRTVAAICYVGAADCMARLKLWSDAERLMTEGSVLSTGEDITELEKEAKEKFEDKEFTQASEIFGKIASAYVASLEQLSDLLPKSGLGEIAIETKSILLHRSSETRVAQAISLLRCNMVQEAIKILSDAAIGFRVALMNLDPLLLVGSPSPSDFKRFSYNLMMSTILYRLLEENDEVDAMFKQLISAKEKKVAEKLEAIQYYKVTEGIREMNLKDAIEGIRNIRLGNLEYMKEDVVGGFEQLLNTKTDARTLSAASRSKVHL